MSRFDEILKLLIPVTQLYTSQIPIVAELEGFDNVIYMSYRLVPNIYTSAQLQVLHSALRFDLQNDVEAIFKRKRELDEIYQRIKLTDEEKRKLAAGLKV